MTGRRLDALLRRNWLLALPFSVLALFPVLAMTTDGTGSRAAIAGFAMALLLTLFLLGLNLSGRHPDAEAQAAELASASSLAPDSASAALLARWLQRSRHFRFVGGLMGAVIGVGFLDGSLMPLALATLAGIALGGATAEIHSLRRRPSTTRSADIAVRAPAGYSTRTDRVALALVGLAGFCLTIAGSLAAPKSSETIWPAALGALVVVLATVVMQRIVVVRPRPALPADLRRADDLMRRLAATQGFTRPAISLALLLLVQSLTEFGNGATVSAISLLLLVLALAWYVASRQNRANLLSFAQP